MPDKHKHVKIALICKFSESKYLFCCYGNEARLMQSILFSEESLAFYRQKKYTELHLYSGLHITGGCG